MEVAVHPAGLPGAASIPERVREAAVHVGLDDRISSIELVFDAPEFEGFGYWDLAWIAQDQVRATLFGSPRDVLVEEQSQGRRPVSGGLDFDEIEALEDDQLDLLRLDRWLHRTLLQLDDLMRHRVRPAEIATEAATGLQACWDVWTDGRLRAWQHPGLSQAERRGVFYRVFASQGLLLPGHWRTFHELWEGQLPDHEGLVEAISRLPRT